MIIKRALSQINIVGMWSHIIATLIAPITLHAHDALLVTSSETLPAVMDYVKYINVKYFSNI